ncbi:MAG TPA: hypothetical protein VGC98_14295 [Thermoleophilaceae bacterium]
MARFDRGMDAVERKLERSRQENRRYFEAIRAQQLADRERLDEILAEGRAGREALFRILDRLDDGGSAPAAG